MPNVASFYIQATQQDEYPRQTDKKTRDGHYSRLHTPQMYVLCAKTSFWTMDWVMGEWGRRAGRARELRHLQKQCYLRLNNCTVVNKILKIELIYCYLQSAFLEQTHKFQTYILVPELNILKHFNFFQKATNTTKEHSNKMSWMATFFSNLQSLSRY